MNPSTIPTKKALITCCGMICTIPKTQAPIRMPRSGPSFSVSESCTIPRKRISSKTGASTIDVSIIQPPSPICRLSNSSIPSGIQSTSGSTTSEVAIVITSPHKTTAGSTRRTPKRSSLVPRAVRWRLTQSAYNMVTAN